MSYQIFDSVDRDLLEGVCRAFEMEVAGGYCPLGLLLERLGVEMSPTPHNSAVVESLVRLYPSLADKRHGLDRSALRFVIAWDKGRITRTSLRRAMGLHRKVNIAPKTREEPS